MNRPGKRGLNAETVSSVEIGVVEYMTEGASSLRRKKPLKVDPDFKNKILDSPGGETLRYCFQCGTCTASCPVIRAAGDTYMVRKLLKMAKLGLKEELLNSEVLWYCAVCHSCEERCPQGVKVAEVLGTLRNLAAEEGNLPKGLKALASNIVKFGLSMEMSEDQEMWREVMGLPPLSKPNLKHVRRIIEETGLAKIVAEGEADEP